MNVTFSLALSPSGILEQLFFERPWPVIVGLLVAGLIFRVLARQRANGRLLVAALAMVGLAGGVYALAWLVTTDREHVQELTRQLVNATEGGVDMQALDELLAAEAVLERHDGAVWLRFAEERDQIQALAERHAIRDHRISRVNVHLAETDTATVDLHLRSELDRQAGVPIPTRWSLTWQRDNDRWQVTRARWSEIRGRSPDEGVAP